jgi:hypothetical protein
MKSLEFLIKTVPRYWNMLMMAFLSLMSGWVFIHLDDLRFNFKYNIGYVDLFTTRIGILSVVFFLVSLVILFLKFSGLRDITSENIAKITNLFSAFFLTTVNSSIYALVLNVYNCLSNNSLLDRIFDSRFLTVSRFWSREALINSIDSKIDELNKSFNSSIRLNNHDYESILNNSSSMSDALKLTDVVYSNKLDEIKTFQNQIVSQQSSDPIIFPYITSFIGNHLIEIGFFGLVIAFGIFCVRTHYIQSYTLNATEGLSAASRNLGAQLTETAGSIDKVQVISDSTSELTRELIQTTGENQDSVLEMLGSLRDAINRLSHHHQQLDLLVSKIRSSVNANETLLNLLIAELMGLDVLPSEGPTSSYSSSSSTFQPFSGEGRSLND